MQLKDDDGEGHTHTHTTAVELTMKILLGKYEETVVEGFSIR